MTWNLLTDFNLTDFNHTDTLEVYQYFYNKYTPKCLPFSHSGKIARTKLAISNSLFNIRVGLTQSRNKENFNLDTKFRKSHSSRLLKTINEMKEKITYKNHIMDEINFLRNASSKCKTPRIRNVPDYIEGVEKPEKAITNLNDRSCFKAKEDFYLIFLFFIKHFITFYSKHS